MQTDLGKDYAQCLDARALNEIATWCDMAAHGLSNRTDDHKTDKEKFLKLAEALRGV
jgi:hypothetical protein